MKHLKNIFFVWIFLAIFAAFTMASVDSISDTNEVNFVQTEASKPAVQKENPSTTDNALADKFKRKSFKKVGASKSTTDTISDLKANSISKSAKVSADEHVSKSKKQNSGIWKTFVHAQKKLREILTEKISAIKSGKWSVIGGFLLICFLYGILHALGPGHGKSIVVGYFLARRGNLKQGVGLGASITFIHTLSAVLLLFVLYAILRATVFPTFEVGRIGIEKASYVLVMITGILIMGLAVKSFIKKNHHAEGLKENASWKEIISVAAITGIVPCPAVALIVLFCLLNSMFILALISALFICLGMAFTNVFFGITAVLMRKGVDKGAAHSGNFAHYIYGSVTFIGGLLVFTSGLLLLCNIFALQV